MGHRMHVLTPDGSSKQVRTAECSASNKWPSNLFVAPVHL